MLCACSTIIFSGWEDSSFSVYDRVRVCVCVSQTRLHPGQRLLKAFAESIQKKNSKLKSRVQHPYLVFFYRQTKKRFLFVTMDTAGAFMQHISLVFLLAHER